VSVDVSVYSLTNCRADVLQRPWCDQVMTCLVNQVATIGCQEMVGQKNVTLDHNTYVCESS
jgi:hypothetical protein